MKAAVIIFPGSNCDRDMLTSLEKYCVKSPLKIWHQDNFIPQDVDLIAIPGGFSYGDYLRSGAIAARSPIMNEVVKAYKKGKYILGVCNGFQVLTETQLLPGTLMRNRDLRFICKDVYLKAVNNNSFFTSEIPQDKVLRIPIAHHDGNYFIDDDNYKKLCDNEQIAFVYTNKNGEVNDDSNPNGSKQNIAGILSLDKKILGMMPHPDRACDEGVGNIDGQILFDSMLQSFR